GKIRLELHGLAKIRRRFTVVAAEKADVSEVEGDLDRVRRQPRSRAQGLLRTAQILLRQECRSQEQPAAAGIGIVLDGLLKQGDGLGHPALVQELVCAREEDLSAGAELLDFLIKTIGPTFVVRQGGGPAALLVGGRLVTAPLIDLGQKE